MAIQMDQIDLAARNPVRLVEATNVGDFTAPPATVDGIATADGDRILCIGQTTTTENGVYVRSGTQWVRASDMDETIPKGTFVYIMDGSATYKNKFYCVGASDITVGTTAQTEWAEVNPSTASGGVSVTSSTNDTLTIDQQSAGYRVHLWSISLNRTLSGFSNLIDGGTGTLYVENTSGLNRSVTLGGGTTWLDADNDFAAASTPITLAGGERLNLQYTISDAATPTVILKGLPGSSGAGIPTVTTSTNGTLTIDQQSIGFRIHLWSISTNRTFSGFSNLIDGGTGVLAVENTSGFSRNIALGGGTTWLDANNDFSAASTPITLAGGDRLYLQYTIVDATTPIVVLKGLPGSSLEITSTATNAASITIDQENLFFRLVRWSFNTDRTLNGFSNMVAQGAGILQLNNTSGTQTRTITLGGGLTYVDANTQQTITTIDVPSSTRYILQWTIVDDALSIVYIHGIPISVPDVFMAERTTGNPIIYPETEERTITNSLSYVDAPIASATNYISQTATWGVPGMISVPPETPAAAQGHIAHIFLSNNNTGFTADQYVEAAWQWNNIGIGRIRMQTDGTTERVYIKEGIVDTALPSVTTALAANIYQDPTTGELMRSTSGRHYKTNITLAAVNYSNLLTTGIPLYQYDWWDGSLTGITGFIADDIESVLGSEAVQKAWILRDATWTAGVPVHQPYAAALDVSSGEAFNRYGVALSGLYYKLDQASVVTGTVADTDGGVPYNQYGLSTTYYKLDSLGGSPTTTEADVDPNTGSVYNQYGVSGSVGSYFKLDFFGSVTGTPADVDPDVGTPFNEFGAVRLKLDSLFSETAVEADTNPSTGEVYNEFGAVPAYVKLDSSGTPTSSPADTLPNGYPINGLYGADLLADSPNYNVILFATIEALRYIAEEVRDDGEKEDAGSWDATTNTPTLSDTNVPVNRKVYYTVSVGGSQADVADGAVVVEGDIIEWSFLDNKWKHISLSSVVTYRSDDFTAGIGSVNHLDPSGTQVVSVPSTSYEGAMIEFVIKGELSSTRLIEIWDTTPTKRLTLDEGVSDSRRIKLVYQDDSWVYSDPAYKPLVEPSLGSQTATFTPAYDTISLIDCTSGGFDVNAPRHQEGRSFKLILEAGNFASNPVTVKDSSGSTICILDAHLNGITTPNLTMVTFISINDTWYFSPNGLFAA